MRILKHPNNTDVAMEVLKKFYIPEKDTWKIKVMWWNIGNAHPPWCMGITQKLVMTASKLKEFKYYGNWDKTIKHEEPDIEASSEAEV